MSANHSILIVVSSSLAAHWIHLESFKKQWCLPRDSDLLVGVITRHQDCTKLPRWDQWTAKVENSCLQRMQDVEYKGLTLFHCQSSNTKFLPLTSVIIHITSYFWKWAIITKAYKMPFTKRKRRSKCVLVSTTHFPSSTIREQNTKETRRNYPETKLRQHK